MTVTQEQIAGMRVALARRFPATFTPPGSKFKRPLALGIRAEIIKIWPTVGRELLAAALCSYTSGPKYFKAMKEGAIRVDIKGDAAGVVTKEQARFQKTRFRIHKRKHAKLNAERAARQEAA